MKYGIKIYGIAISKNGYVRNWIIYTGSKFNGVTPYEAVYKFIEILPRQSHLFFDSLFGSAQVLRLLSINNFFFTASIRKGRKGFPTLPKKKNKLNKNEYNFYKDLSNNIVLVQFQSKKLITIASNFYKATIIEKDEKETNSKYKKPYMVEQYNLKARGIDRNNQNSSYYFCNRRSIKWYRKIFLYSLEVCVTNSYIMYKEDKNPLISLLDFRLSIIKGLSNAQIKLDNNFKNKTHRLHGKHFIMKIPHKKRKDCKVCSTSNKRISSRYECETCQVGLCIEICFKKYHTLNTYK